MLVVAGGVDADCVFDAVDDEEEVEYDLLLLCEFHDELPFEEEEEEELVNENDRVDKMDDEFSILRPKGTDLFEKTESNMAIMTIIKQYLNTLVENSMYS